MLFLRHRRHLTGRCSERPPATAHLKASSGWSTSCFTKHLLLTYQKQTSPITKTCTGWKRAGFQRRPKRRNLSGIVKVDSHAGAFKAIQTVRKLFLSFFSTKSGFFWRPPCFQPSCLNVSHKVFITHYCTDSQTNKQKKSHETITYI